MALSEGAGAVRRRAQTSTERDLAGIAAKKEREAAAPEVAFDDITGQYAHDPVTLSQMRARRSTAERLAHMERKYDALVKQLVESKTRVVQSVIASRTKIVTAIISAVAGIAAGYIAGGCL